MENIQNKSALIPSDEIRSEELLAEQKFERMVFPLFWYLSCHASAEMLRMFFLPYRSCKILALT